MPINGLIVSASNDQTIKVWNPTTGLLNKTLTTTAPIYIHNICLLFNGLLAVGSYYNTIKLYDINTCVSSPAIYVAGLIRPLVELPNGLVAVGLENSIITLIDLASSSTNKSFSSTGAIYSMISLSNSQCLITGDSNGIVNVWDVTTGVSVQSFVAHIGGITALGELKLLGLLATGGYTDNKIKLWNLINWSLVKTFSDHKNGISSFVFLSNGLLASASSDSTIKLWDVRV